MLIEIQEKRCLIYNPGAIERCEITRDHSNPAVQRQHMLTGHSRCITLLFSTQLRLSGYDKKYTCHTESRYGTTQRLINENSRESRVGYTSEEVYVRNSLSRRSTKHWTNVTKKQRDLLPSTGSSLTMFLHTVLDPHDTVQSFSLLYNPEHVSFTKKNKKRKSKNRWVLLRR